MFYSREHCNYNRQSAPFDYHQFPFQVNHSAHFNKQNFNHGPHGGFDHPGYENFGNFRAKHSSRKPPFRKTFTGEVPGFYFFPPHMHSPRFFGPMPLYETFITPESAYIVLQDPNNLTVQFTQVRKAPNGQQQRVTIQQDFNDQEELKQFLVDIEQKLMPTKPADTAEKGKQRTGVVVVEEPEENAPSNTTTKTNAAEGHEQPVFTSEAKVKTNGKSSPVAPTKETFATPEVVPKHTDASNESDSSADSEHRQKKQSKKRRQRTKKSFYINDWKQQVPHRSKKDESETLSHSFRTRHHQSHTDDINKNFLFTSSNEFSSLNMRRPSKNPYIDDNDRTLKKGKGRKLQKVKLRDLYDGYSNNHVAFSEDAIFAEDQLKPKMNHRYRRSKSASARRNLHHPTSYMETPNLRYFEPSPYPNHRYFEPSPFQPPPVLPINQMNNDQWFRLPHHHGNITQHPRRHGMHHSVPARNRSFLQQNQF